MASYSQLIEKELAASPIDVSPKSEAALPRCNRWTRKPLPTPEPIAPALPAPPVPSAEHQGEQRQRRHRPSPCPSYILQHYHSTGCCGGAFSWRAAMLDPTKKLVLCTEPREYRKTTMEDIQLSLDDKRRGGGPRVGPFQNTIPGEEWHALPKYDFTTRNRSSAFNERMHVEWENHVDHILANEGKLPTASVVAKAGFRSCSPCCRDMLALAKPTGTTFIMVDLAEQDHRGTFHFVIGANYLPVPKEACSIEEVLALKKIVSDAQDGVYESSNAIYNAVMELNPPIDEVAQAMYLGDQALLPEGCASTLCGQALLDVLHAEHFARLPAEYGASILRDNTRSHEEQKAVHRCRSLAKELLLEAWTPQLTGIAVDLEAYVDAAVMPLLPDDPSTYARLKVSGKRASAKQASSRSGERRLIHRRFQNSSSNSRKKMQGYAASAGCAKPNDFDDTASIAAASTALPDDALSLLEDDDDEQDLGFGDYQDEDGNALASQQQ